MVDMNMRKLYNILYAALVALVLASCQNNDESLNAVNQRGTIEFTLGFNATRSHFGDKSGSAYPSFWDGNEKLRLAIESSDYPTYRPSGRYAMEKVDAEGKSATFTATIDQYFSNGTVYAFVPATAWHYNPLGNGDFAGFEYTIPATQTPTAKSVDPAAHILMVQHPFSAGLQSAVSLNFDHIVAYGKLSIPALEGEDVTSVQIDILDVSGKEYSYTLNVSGLEEPLYWFACEPCSASAISIVTTTADKQFAYTREFDAEAAVAFNAGHVRPLTIAGELIESSQPEPTYPNREIHYTATAKVVANSDYPWSFDTFGANIVSNEWNSETGEGVITFDADVTTIGGRAFYRCYSLTSITIPDSVTTIGEKAFTYCTNLVEFNGKLASEDGRCLIIDGVLNNFAPAGLTSYTIPDSVTTIGDYSFDGYDRLTSITIGDSVTTIGNSAFWACSSLTSVTIGDSVTTIGDYAFLGCKSLTSVTIPDSVTTIGDYAFRSCGILTSVTIGDSVTTIGDYAFYYCDSLTSVYCAATTPPSLGGDSVFDDNASGRKIYVPAASVEAYKSAEYWSEYADAIIAYDFENGVVVEPEVSANNEIRYTATAKVEANSYYPWSFDTFGANVVSHEWNSESGEGVITFDADVTTIGSNAFDECSSLTSITIPDSVMTIGDFTFLGCSSLTSVTIPDSVMTIGDFTFKNCTSLTSVTIPDSVTTIGDWAFSVCDSLTSVTIPDSATSIGNGAFFHCSSLTEFNGKFASEDGRCLIVNGTLNSFAIGCGATEYTIPDSVTTIGGGAFEFCDSLTSVTIGDSVTTIGNSVFKYCKRLTSVYCTATTPPSLGGGDVFDDNASDRKIYVPSQSVESYKSAEYWSEYADAIVGYDFASGEVVTLANREIRYTATAKVEAYSNYAFGANVVSNEWNSETGEGVISFDGDVTTIGDSAFYYCKSLTSVTIPDSVTTIGSKAFSFCSNLTSVTIPESVTSIGDYAFDKCDSLTSVTIGNSVTTIGNYAFDKCDSLTSVTIGNSVTTIGSRAFGYCTSLTSVTIPDSVTTIGEGAFTYCSSLTEFDGKFVSEDGRCLIIDGVLNSFAPAELTSYIISDSVTTIGDSAFLGCTSLTSVAIPNSVTTIGDLAFSGCNGLTSITIPFSVVAIGDEAFCICYSLESVYCEATTPPVGGSKMFYSMLDEPLDCVVYVPAASVEAYKTAEYWTEYADAIVGYDF